MFSKLSAFILRLWGWTVRGTYPHHLKKYIIIVMPHTSAWDLPLGFLLRSMWKSDVKFLGKAELFRPPFGFLFYWLGGYPVERSQRHNYVDTVANIFKSKDRFSITIAPEGTRKKVDRLKTGFYYIAKAANVPIVMCKFDFGRKTVEIAEPFYPSWNRDADFQVIYHFFKGATGKIPEYTFCISNDH